MIHFYLFLLMLTFIGSHGQVPIQLAQNGSDDNLNLNRRGSSVKVETDSLPTGSTPPSIETTTGKSVHINTAVAASQSDGPSPLTISTTSGAAAPPIAATPTSGSEASDMRNSSYEGGSDVNEIGPGNRLEHPSPKEDAVHRHKQIKEMTDEKRGMSSATATAIVISVCIGVVVIGYASLFVWKLLRIKRNNCPRELLVNEEDTDITDEDLRHFEAACIQLDPEA